MERVFTMMRHELKYILTPEQYAYFVDAIKDRMIIDEYGNTTIYSIYYDTNNYQMIRASIENPSYKEKIRVRSYGVAEDGKELFVEIKRKNNNIVYKRRVATTEKDISKVLDSNFNSYGNNQIMAELHSFKKNYPILQPCILIVVDRTSYIEPNGEVRITFDENSRYRTSNLGFYPSDGEKPLLQNGYVILEIKIKESMPLWLCDILTKGHIYVTSFSKVGEAYKKELKLKYNLEGSN